MTHQDLMVEEFLKKQSAAQRVILAIQQARKREDLPSALQVADTPLAIEEDHSFYNFRTDPMRPSPGAIRILRRRRAERMNSGNPIG